ncbi:hypothetical protein ACFYY8_35135 [Streptosporangium sp. NPDC001559]|uniref:hypothetical protein n=1 Tax=Streptosporangium sp. NPDC001559 TaxID=3366187 RepID=UPI0036E1AAB6
MLTLTAVAEDPLALTRHLNLNDGSEVVFRPLVHTDAERLAGFLEGLSAESRRLSTFDGYDLGAARKLCDAIARYDKLRLVLEDVSSGRVVGLVEFGLDLHPADLVGRRTGNQAELGLSGRCPGAACFRRVPVAPPDREAGNPRPTEPARRRRRRFGRRSRAEFHRAVSPPRHR